MLLTALAVVVLVAAALLMLRSSVDANQAPTVATMSPSPSGYLGCSDVRIASCREVETESGRIVRYAVLEGSTGHGEAAVFDAGGPGLSVFGAHWPTAFDESVRPALPEVPVVLIEEPWVTSELLPQCAAAMSEWYQQAHAARDVTASLSPCSLGEGRWGWTSDSYAEAIRAIEKSSGLNVDAFIGASFGAFRAQYIGKHLRWAALANPAPATMDGREYLRQRHDAVWSMLQTLCDCSGRELQVHLDGLAGAASEQHSQRSIPITSADVATAALALAYRPGDVEAFRSFWDADPEVIGRLADSVWGRFGSDRISPSYLAYLDEVCSAYAPWPTKSDDADDIARALSAIHAPCGDVQIGSVEPLPRRVKTCVSANSGDPIAPPAFVETWGANLFVREDGDEHSDVLAVSKCIDAVRVP